MPKLECEVCYGRGEVKDICSSCHGSGCAADMGGVIDVCDLCGGTGGGASPCSSCGGTGEVEEAPLEERLRLELDEHARQAGWNLKRWEQAQAESHERLLRIQLLQQQLDLAREHDIRHLSLCPKCGDELKLNYHGNAHPITVKDWVCYCRKCNVRVVDEPTLVAALKAYHKEYGEGAARDIISVIERKI